MAQERFDSAWAAAVAVLTEDGLEAIASGILEDPGKHVNNPVPLARAVAVARVELLKAMRPLEGVLCLVDVQLEGGDGDPSESYKQTLTGLGAKVVGPSSKKATHLVFQNGDAAVYHKAQEGNLAIVSPKWVDECEAQKCRVDEADARYSAVPPSIAGGSKLSVRAPGLRAPAFCPSCSLHPRHAEPSHLTPHRLPWPAARATRRAAQTQIAEPPAAQVHRARPE